MFTRFCIALTLAVATASAVGRAQQAPPPQQPAVTFRSEVNYVEVDVLVTDRDGNFVRGLTRDDFEIVDEGRPQTIDVFAEVDIPLERAEQPLAATQPIEPDVATNARPFDGRVYLIVLDDLHTAALRSTRVRDAARQFLERHFGANDLAAVVHTSGRPDASQEFTSNKRLLLDAVDKFMGRGLRSELENKLEDYYRRAGTPMASDPASDFDARERAAQARNAMESVANLAQFMSSLSGRRKAMLFFSEGVGVDTNDFMNNLDATSVLDAQRRAIAAATRANVHIYAIDPRGLTSGGDDLIGIQSFPTDTSTGLTSSALRDELRRSQDSLRTLADETGGFAAVSTNDFAGAFDRIVRENSTYYVLGYYPPDARADGKFHKITVRVKNPNLRVQAREGYYAPRRGTTTAAARNPIDAMLAAPMRVSGLPMAVTADAFKGPDGNATVAVAVDVDAAGLRFDDAGGTANEDLTLAWFAVGPSGKPLGAETQDIQMRLRPQTRDAIAAHGFRVTGRLTLPPGRYQLRVAATSKNAGAEGSVFYDLEVPDFTKAPLVMSGIALTSRNAAQAPTRALDPALKETVLVPPSARRTFRPDDILALYTEVYDNDVRAPHGVDIRVSLRDDTGAERFATTDERHSSELGGRPGGYGVRTEVPLTGLKPGLYTVTVTATSRATGGATVARELLIRIAE